MNDTSARTQARLNALYREKSPLERLAMASSMFATAKEIVSSSILAENPGLSAPRLREKIFLRFYKDDFPPGTLRKILHWIKT